jgi:hypothetical protein
LECAIEVLHRRALGESGAPLGTVRGWPAAAFVGEGFGRIAKKESAARTVLERKGVFDERPCERGRRFANARYLAAKLLIIGRLARSEASYEDEGREVDCTIRAKRGCRHGSRSLSSEAWAFIITLGSPALTSSPPTSI